MLRVAALLLVSLIGASAAALGDEPTHWAFRPPVRPTVPAVQASGWLRTPIDAFVVRGLERHGLTPSPEADRATLLRRLTVDLTGLPPSPDEVWAFLTDRAPDAYERAVDRLLASPAHGERWAQHWLDLARYADTDGFEFDQARPDSWRYRDWVVRALNADLPYDRFVTLQIAGDEVAPDDPDASLATGFNRCYPDMVDLNDQGLRRQNALNDITETVGLAFLGLTVGCARCHDHKFDPIPQADFYRLQAFFAPARFRDDYPLATASERADDEARRADARRLAAELQSTLLAIEAPWRTLLAPGPPPGLDDDASAAWLRPPGDRNAREVGLVFEATRRDRRVRPEVLTRLTDLDPVAAAVRPGLLSRLKGAVAATVSRLPVARVIDEDGSPPPVTRLLLRGEFSTPGPTVAPGVPGALVASPDAVPPIRPAARSSGRRSALAAWLTRPDHPLTARVIVNRLWQHHFGRGLVATPSDFGTMGEEPTHPELLDWLATELVARGGSLKALHRLMVTSATYRQSSAGSPASLAGDPDGHLLSRYRRVRLDGEAIRDALLATGGRLSRRVGGPPVFPELPAELTRLSSKGAVWPVSETAEERSRRSLYVFVRRNLRYPFFEAFDRPDTNASCPERARTTIAPQALTLLNGRISAEPARAFAGRLAAEAGDDPAAWVRLAFLIAFGRPADAEDLRASLAFLADEPDLARFCLALLNANEFVYID